jgi:hypothetical protein
MYMVRDWWDKAGSEQCYTNVKAIISQEDILLICQDYKTYGLCSANYLERSIKSNWSQTFKIEYIPIYKLGVTTMAKIKSMVIGTLMIGEIVRDKPTLYPKFTGKDNGKTWNSLRT